GSSWSVVPSPHPGVESSFYGVSAISSNDVWAVGYYTDGPQRTLVEHWDGAQWSVIPSPNASTLNNILRGVAAISANDVWAVGSYMYYPYEGISFGTLALHWDGNNWNTVP